VTILAHGVTGSSGPDAGLLLAAVGLGLFHGLNPGMGWLFAVSYGLQEKSSRAIGRSLVPIAIGHELSVLPVALAVAVFSSQVTRAVALGVFSVGLVAFGAWLLLRKRHFRWVGMRLNALQLAWWSFLMSTVTGAGLMLAPALMRQSEDSTPLVDRALAGQLEVAALAAGVHALAMLATAAAMALLVYHVFGLRILKTAWINLDRIWALAFVGAGLTIWFV
jgi:hypothetical protein